MNSEYLNHIKKEVLLSRTIVSLMFSVGSLTALRMDVYFDYARIYIPILSTKLNFEDSLETDSGEAGKR